MRNGPEVDAEEAEAELAADAGASCCAGVAADDAEDSTTSDSGAVRRLLPSAASSN